MNDLEIECRHTHMLYVCKHCGGELKGDTVHHESFCKMKPAFYTPFQKAIILLLFVLTFIAYVVISASADDIKKPIRRYTFVTNAYDNLQMRVTTNAFIFHSPDSVWQTKHEDLRVKQESRTVVISSEKYHVETTLRAIFTVSNGVTTIRFEERK